MTCCLYCCHTDYAVSHAVTVSALSKKMPWVCRGRALIGSRCTGSKKLASPQHPPPGTSLPEKAWEPAAAPRRGSRPREVPSIQVPSSGIAWWANTASFLPRLVRKTPASLQCSPSATLTLSSSYFPMTWEVHLLILAALAAMVRGAPGAVQGSTHH